MVPMPRDQIRPLDTNLAADNAQAGLRRLANPAVPPMFPESDQRPVRLVGFHRGHQSNLRGLFRSTPAPANPERQLRHTGSRAPYSRFES